MDILMLISTSGLEYDDRLRKETRSLIEIGNQVRIAALERRNRRGSKLAYDGAKVNTLSLSSRRWFAQGRGLLIKESELYWRFFCQILRFKPHVLWIHNLEMIGFIPAILFLRRIGLVKRIVWDQHELPSDRLLRSRLYISFYEAMANACDVVIMANEERQALIEKKLKHQLKVSVSVLHNYPDTVFARLAFIDLPDDVKDWLGNAEYVLAQGGANPSRHLNELVASILRQSVTKLIVVGPYQKRQLDAFSEEYGERWHEFVLFTGPIPQLGITPYIDYAVASIVFYTMRDSNQSLCAPNRLFQALVRGIPVIVGPNPPMKRLIAQYECGVVVDHENPDDILKGIEAIRLNPARYRMGAHAAAAVTTWEREEETIRSILSAWSD